MTHEFTLDERVLRFFKEFRDEEDRPKYINYIRALPEIEDKTVPVYFEDIFYFDSELAKIVSDEPDRFIDTAKDMVMEILKIERPVEASSISRDSIYIAILGESPGYSIKIRDISSRYLNKLVTIYGLLIKVSQVYSIPIKAVFQCPRCGETQTLNRESVLHKISRPRCSHHKNIRMELVKERTVFNDVQTARIQEKPDELPPGQIPRFIDILLAYPMIDKAYPGDVVKVTGVLDLRKRGGRESYEYDFVLRVISIESREKEAMEVVITKKEEEEFRRLAREEGFYDKLIRSIAPSIYGYKDVKEAILLSLIGGEDRELRDGTRIRGKIHLLLIGDPGVAKSQLLKYAAYIAPKGIYTSGRGSTAAGLTAAVIKEAGGGMSLEAGAVVLADMGICAIDEIDKMRNEDRVALHEAMEQMTVSISKGGIVATLNARTTIIAAANPVDGVYNPYKTLKDNINLPVTLLSRFDLIRLMRDELRTDLDIKLTEHMLKARESEEPYEDTFDPDFMRKYIAYARRIKVHMTREAFEKLQQYFINLRASASQQEETLSIPITPRQFEALIRLAEASAKAHLRNFVSVEDAEIAINQMNLFLGQLALNMETGTIDSTLITAGVSARRASKYGVVASKLKELQMERGNKPVPEEELIARIVKDTTLKDPVEIRRIIDKLKIEGVILEPQPGFYKLVRDI